MPTYSNTSEQWVQSSSSTWWNWQGSWWIPSPSESHDGDAPSIEWTGWLVDCSIWKDSSGQYFPEFNLFCYRWIVCSWRRSFLSDGCVNITPQMSRFRGAKSVQQFGYRWNWRSQHTVWLQVQKWTKSENSILVCHSCVVTLHDYTTDTIDDMTTMIIFHTEHINTNTWVCLILFIFCQRIVTMHTTPQGSSPRCVRHSSHTHALMMCAVLLRHWSLYSLHLLPHAPPVALFPLPHLEARRVLVHFAQKKDMASIDETYSFAGYEPNAYDFKETSVESYTELLTSPPFLFKQGFPGTPSTIALSSRVCFVKLTEYTAITTVKPREFITLGHVCIATAKESQAWLFPVSYYPNSCLSAAQHVSRIILALFAGREEKKEHTVDESHEHKQAFREVVALLNHLFRHVRHLTVCCPTSVLLWLPSDEKGTTIIRILGAKIASIRLLSEASSSGAHKYWHHPWAHDDFKDRSNSSFWSCSRTTRTNSGVLCGLICWKCVSIVNLGQWIVIRHPKGHLDWHYVRPKQRLLVFQ